MTLREITRTVISLVENVSGCPVVVSDDASLKTLAVSRIARGANRIHAVSYNPSVVNEPDYLICYQRSGVGSRILNFIYHPQLSPFRNSESTIMSVLGRIQLENGKTGWERSGMADVAMALFLCRM